MWYVYILSSNIRKDWHYYGMTHDLRRRFEEHSAGKVDSTAPMRPLKVIYYEAYLTQQMAAKRERQLKRSRSATKAVLTRLEDTGE